LLAGKVGKGIDEEVHKAVKIPAKKIILDGELSVPANSQGIVIFAHGSGSSYRSSRNQYVAQALNQIGFSTLVFDLLTPEESNLRANVFNVPLLADRLRLATNWVRDNEGLSRLSLGYFGASTGAAAALAAAAQEKNISSVVCRGGRPDLAGAALGGVNCPTLLIVGGEDHGVIELNQEAKSRLREGELVIVPGAGHLFEEPGALENVVGHASNWFLKTLVKPNIDLVAKPHQRPLGELLKMVQPIDSEESFDALLKEIRDSKVVMLGEATHGTEEFYEIRKVISKKLIEEHGFKFIAVEGDWPDCNKLNKYIQLRDTSSAKSIMSGFKRWPTWMWANEQVADLIEWMRGRGAGFYGLDIYSLYESLDLIKSYALKLNPKMEERVLEAYSCIEWFDRNDIEYAKTIIRWPHGCESEIIRNLREILRLRLEETKLFEYELFDMKQNAVIVHNAKKYCSALLYGGADSWNVRDEHMMDTLDALLQYYGDGAKGIVWAHNTHIGDYHATDMVSEGYVNLGGLARERYGMDNVSLVGFGTNEGTVLAGRAWEARAEIMNLPPAANGSYENYFHEVADQLEKKQIYVITKGLESLKLRKGHRAIGVVYQSGFETQGKNYVPTELGNRYDVFVFVDKTTSLNALPEVFEKGVIPKTWPSGF
jgi:erythromycin esterase-like protein/pimeloyl-ACP methyl ester carboxylesterase